jgi:hypothetical protein
MSGSGALKRALEAIGYWPAPTERPAPRSIVETIDAAIEHETGRRLGLLGSWLADRRAFFAGVFEEDERRAIRIRLRRVAAGFAAPSDRGSADAGVVLPRRVREELERAADLAGLLRALKLIRSPYAAPLREALRAHGEDLVNLEFILDRSFARRAQAAAQRFGGRLREWVMDSIDIDNAWSAAAGQEAGFIDGGLRLSRARHATIAGRENERERRAELARVFVRGPFASVFDDPETSLAQLESRVLRARIAHERRVGRRDPIGASPILECVMRVRAECADLRRINWGVAAGLRTEAIVGQLLVAT